MSEDLTKLLQYCATETQTRMIEAVIEHNGNRKEAADANGWQATNVSRAIRIVTQRATKYDFKSYHNKEGVAPEGFSIKGTSTLYDNEGNPKIQWVKTTVDAQRQQEMMREAIDAMCEDLPKVEPIDGPLYSSDDLMAIYPVGDPHVGMLSWGEETGQDWDLSIAENVFYTVFDRLVKTAPQCKEAVIINLGDFYHYDNMEGTTSRSKHSLDTDGRYAKMVKIGVKIMRQMINSALEHHEHVRVINAIGNHDDTGAIFLSVCLANIYENEPRVTIDQRPAPFHYIQFGKCMASIHHGHTCKMDRLPGVMASDQPVMWGESEFRYGYMGHVHHDHVKEFPGVTVESFRTLAAKDAYAAWNGYRAGQDSKCIVWHRRHGEVERHTVNISIMSDTAL